MDGAFAADWLPVPAGLALKSLLLFAVAGAALLALRRASAAARHLACLLTLAALLALPVLSLTLPGWHLAVLAAPRSSAAEAPHPSPLLREERGSERTDQKEQASSRSPSFPTLGPSPLGGEGGELASRVRSAAPASHRLPGPAVFLALWLVGIFFASLRPLLGLWGIARLSRLSRPVTDPGTLALSAECASALGLSRMPALRQADAPVPMTWGGRRPVVLLPAEAPAWPEDRRQAVLLHELAHVRRHDWLSHRFADVVCAVYWFHPLVWLTARRLRAEGEIACDDLVLTSGVAAPDYARLLLDVARAFRPAAVPQAAIALARTARLEGRLKMILDPTRPRRALTRRVLFLALGLSAAALVPLAVLRLNARAQAAAPGTASPRHLTVLPVTTATPAFASGRGVIQLAGIATPSALNWWGVDGTRLSQPVFNLTPASQSGDVTDPKQRRVLLALRLSPFAQDVTVRYTLTGCLGFSSGGSWPSKIEDHDRQTEAQLNSRTNGVRVVTATFPASASRTNVRVGTAFGSWNVFGTARRDASGQIEGLSIQRGGAGYIVSPLAETKEGTVMTVSVNTAPNTSADDFRVVAVDTKGHQLLPTQLGDSGLGGLAQITAHFALPPAQIAAIHLESRPFHYVEFKNVALLPRQ